MVPEKNSLSGVHVRYIFLRMPNLYRDSRGLLCLAEGTGAACKKHHSFRHNTDAYIWPGSCALSCKRIVKEEDPALEENMPSPGGTTLRERQAFEPPLTQDHSPSLTSSSHHPNPADISPHAESYQMPMYLVAALPECVRKPSARTLHLGPSIETTIPRERGIKYSIRPIDV